MVPVKSDRFWRSAMVRALIDAHDLGALIRLARERRGWSQQELGKAAGFSRSTVSRLETSRTAITDMAKLRLIVGALEIPPSVLAELLGLAEASAVTVVTNVATAALEDPMRRRSFVAAGLAVPLSALVPMDKVLAAASPPALPLNRQQIMRQLMQARRLWHAGELNRLLSELPELLATAGHAAGETQDSAGFVLAGACYDLAAEALNKVGANRQAHTAADWAALHADRSEDPVAMAAAARTRGIVLRHEGQHQLAEQLTLQAAARVARAGLADPAQARTYAQMLATSAYNAALADDRDRALEMIEDAWQAVIRLPEQQPPGWALSARFPIDRAQVSLYKVGVRWALGDAGEALAAGRDLRPGMFPTPERRARLHTDMARAEWLRGRPEQATQRLLAAHAQAPAEMAGRPAIRRMAVQMVQRHPRVHGARELAAIVRPDTRAR
ncbi:Transcriptional regulator, contains XRE-family HTH domain [Actinomadura madurae]|uniref:Transcriptional regulator, contains XRE-family HTH domain n=1 Tax=Actinomadura madurae TaxID=1993 RepID=A0A1I5J020_9ACTN|nr:helix-turn-helix transcriptional regulator [Actinomadura madurae]SFO66117.1 Transcriptional regulator, contains XRE-family HTH domain [Actinomadura madurae]